MKWHKKIWLRLKKIWLNLERVTALFSVLTLAVTAVAMFQTARIAGASVDMANQNAVLVSAQISHAREELDEQKTRAERDYDAQRHSELNNRFSAAVERLESSSLHVRMAGLFELQQLGLDESEFQGRIVRILGPFIRSGIEHRLVQATIRTGQQQPARDVYLAADIVALFENVGYSMSLEGLRANRRGNIDYREINFQGADLRHANFRGAFLRGVVFQNANLRNADFRGAMDLTVEQLLSAYIDEHTQLDDDLCVALASLRADHKCAACAQ